MKISKGMIIFICVLNVLLTISFSLRFSKPDSTVASITLDSKNKNKVKDSPPQNKNADDNTNPSEGENTNSGFEKDVDHPFNIDDDSKKSQDDSSLPVVSNDGPGNTRKQNKKVDIKK